MSRGFLSIAALSYLAAGVMLANAAWVMAMAIKAPRLVLRFGFLLVVVVCILIAIGLVVSASLSN